MNNRFSSREISTKTFGGRLLYLYNLNGKLINGKIDFIAVATELYEKNFREYSPYIPQREKSETDSERRRQRKNTSDILRKHIRVEDATTISGEWLNIYHNYFMCSTDFLLGYIEFSTHEQTDIAKVTGLSEKAILSLKEPIFHLNHSFHGLDVINFLCENYDGNEGTYKLLDSIYGYFSLEYSIPVYHDGTSISTPKNTNDKTKANRLSLAASFNYDLNDDTPMLTLAKPDNFHDYIKFRMDKDFLASVHMNNIREQLIKLSDNYTVAES